MLHRDVKSLNIFLAGPLDQSGRHLQYRLGDVGVSKVEFPFLFVMLCLSPSGANAGHLSPGTLLRCPYKGPLACLSCLPFHPPLSTLPAGPGGGPRQRLHNDWHARLSFPRDLPGGRPASLPGVRACRVLSVLPPPLERGLQPGGRPVTATHNSTVAA